MNKKNYDDILPDDGKLFGRVNLWNEFCEKYNVDHSKAEIEIQDVVSFEQESIEYSSDSEKFEDNSIPDEEQDPEFDVQKVLDNTLQIVHTREDKWRRNGISQAMTSFSVNPAEKVQHWIKNNAKYNDISCFSETKKCVDDKFLNEEYFCSNRQSSDDDSLHSVNTAKYIMSNRKAFRSTHISSMTIKQFCCNKQQKFSKHSNKSLINGFKNIRSSFNCNSLKKNFNTANEEERSKSKQKIKPKKKTKYYCYLENSNNSSDQSVSNIVCKDIDKSQCKQSAHNTSKNLDNKKIKIETHQCCEKNVNLNEVKNLTTSRHSEIDFNTSSIINSTEINKTKNNKNCNSISKNYNDNSQLENSYTSDSDNSQYNPCSNEKRTRIFKSNKKRISRRTILKEKSIGDLNIENRKLTQGYDSSQDNLENSNLSTDSDRSYTSNNVSCYDSDETMGSTHSLILKSRRKYFRKQKLERHPIYTNKIQNKKKLGKSIDLQIEESRYKTISIEKKKIKKKDKKTKLNNSSQRRSSNKNLNGNAHEKTFCVSKTPLENVCEKTSSKSILNSETIISSSESDANNIPQSIKSLNINSSKFNAELRYKSLSKSSLVRKPFINTKLKSIAEENSPLSEKNSINKITNPDSTIVESPCFKNQPKDLKIFHSNNQYKKNLKKNLRWNIDESPKIPETSCFTTFSRSCEHIKDNLCREFQLQTPEKHKILRLQAKEKLMNPQISNQIAINLKQERNKLITNSNSLKMNDKTNIESDSEIDFVKEISDKKSKYTINFQKGLLKNQLSLTGYENNAGSCRTPSKRILNFSNQNRINDFCQTPKRTNISCEIHSENSINNCLSKTATSRKSFNCTEPHIVLYDPICVGDTIKQFDTDKVIIDETILKNKIGLKLMKKFLNGKKTYEQAFDSGSTIIFILPIENKSDNNFGSEEDDLDQFSGLLNGNERGKIVEILNYNKKDSFYVDVKF